MEELQSSNFFPHFLKQSYGGILLSDGQNHAILDIILLAPVIKTLMQKYCAQF